jgi:hypothetical protein
MGLYLYYTQQLEVEWNQLVNPATWSPADDVHHYVIPQSCYWPIDSIFNKFSLFMLQWEEEKAVLYPAEVPTP